MTNPPGAMPPLPTPEVLSTRRNRDGDPMEIKGHTTAQMYDYAKAYAAPHIARVAELQAELSRARCALENISEMTYDSWTNGARAKQIADAAIAAKD